MNPYRELPDELYEQLVHAPHTPPVASTANGTCITVAAAGGYISFQDSKLPEQERRARTQVYTPAELAAFVADAKAGRYDHLI
jgi:Domain of unknown function (DUF397)